jgi:hypothetical protein
MGRPSCPALMALSTVACILLMAGLSHACPVLSEVHPKGVEWVEIENPCNATLNLSEWFISDNYSDDEITCDGTVGCTLETGAGYFLIIGRNINLSNVTAENVPYFFTDDKMIGNGLSDSGDLVRLYNSTYESSMAYGSSSDKSWSYCNGTWVETNATPGHANDCPVNVTDAEEEGENPSNATDDNETADEGYDFGEARLDVENPAGTVRFGDFAVVKARLYTGNMQVPMRVVAYIRRPNGIANDLYGNTIYANLNETDTKTALLIRDAGKGENLTLFIPVFLKSNCDGKFPEGQYSGNVNVYEEGTGEKVAYGSFNMTLQGNNPLFCCEECDECKKCECKKSSCTSGVSFGGSVAPATGTAAAPVKKSFKYFDIDYMPSAVPAGEAFSANITIKNILSAGADFTAYSYVYNGSTCLSLGRAPAGWVKGWDANSRSVTVAAGGREGLELGSMIPEDVPPGTYSYRIRVRYGDEREDATFALNVLEAEEEPAAGNATSAADASEETGNITDEMPAQNTTKDGVSVTGMAAAQGGGQKDAFSIFYEAIASFFALFKF